MHTKSSKIYFEFKNIVSIFVLYFYLLWLNYVIVYFFKNFFCSIQRINNCLVSFSKFSDVLPAFTCASTTDNLWRICLRVNISRHVSSSWLLNSTIFATISIILFGFSFLGVYFLIIDFLNLLNESIVCLTIFLDWSTLIKLFEKNDGFWYPKYSLNVSLPIPFSSFMIWLMFL